MKLFPVVVGMVTLCKKCAEIERKKNAQNNISVDITLNSGDCYRCWVTT